MSTNMPLRTIAGLMRDALLDNTALNDYCTDTLEEELTVQIGSNPQQPLGEANSPYVVLVPNGKGLGDTQVHQFIFTLACGYKDTTHSDYQDNGAIEVRGIYRIEALMDLALAAIKTISKNYSIIAEAIDINSDAFPLHLGITQLTLTAPNVLGGTLGL